MATPPEKRQRLNMEAEATETPLGTVRTVGINQVRTGTLTACEVIALCLQV